MITDYIEKNCCGCEACKNVCEVSAIKMEMDVEGFLYPSVDHEVCVQCGRCEKCCPVLQKKLVSKANTNGYVRAFACYNNDLEIRLESTSGGVFSLIAEKIVSEFHGCVCGAVFEEDFQVSHKIFGKMEELKLFRGSKYVQSKMGEAYKEIGELLSRGKTVLFSGLPCQTEALLSFLGQEYTNLICIDMACYGIASPMIWNKYLNEYYKNVQEVVFKDKINGWKDWSFKITANGKTEYHSKAQGIYMKSFLSGINVRPSCFECKFKGIHRKSDFTIADCWGIGEQNERLNDNRGLTALLVHTPKGEAILETIIDRMKYEEYDPDVLMQENWAVYRSCRENELRQDFFEDLNKVPFREVMENYFQQEV